MLTAKQAMDGLLTAGLCTTGSVERQKKQDDHPVYTLVYGRGRVSVSEETYGRSESEMYLRCEDEAASQEAQTLLKGLGGTPNLGWCSENPCHFSCSISPIKGWHWWE